MTAFDWTPIRYRNVISVLKNPFYAGAYAYGAEPATGRRTFDLAFDLVHDAGLERLVSAVYPLDRYVDAISHAASAGSRGAVKIAFDQRRAARAARGGPPRQPAAGPEPSEPATS